MISALPAQQAHTGVQHDGHSDLRACDVSARLGFPVSMPSSSARPLLGIQRPPKLFNSWLQKLVVQRHLAAMHHIIPCPCLLQHKRRSCGDARLACRPLRLPLEHPLGVAAASAARQAALGPPRAHWRKPTVAPIAGVVLGLNAACGSRLHGSPSPRTCAPNIEEETHQTSATCTSSRLVTMTDSKLLMSILKRTWVPS